MISRPVNIGMARVGGKPISAIQTAYATPRISEMLDSKTITLTGRSAYSKN